MKGQSGVAKRQRKQNDKCLTVIVRHIAAPDAKQRLSRVVNILLKTAAKSTIAEEEKLPRSSSREEGLTGGKLSEAVKGQQNV
jgi:hypothetical protein